MKNKIFLSLLYFGLFGFNSVKSITLDDVVKVSIVISAAITIKETYETYIFLDKFLNAPTISKNDRNDHRDHSQYLINSEYYNASIKHSKKAFLAACITCCLAFHKEIKKLIRK